MDLDKKFCKILANVSLCDKEEKRSKHINERNFTHQKTVHFHFLNYFPVAWSWLTDIQRNSYKMLYYFQKKE